MTDDSPPGTSGRRAAVARHGAAVAAGWYVTAVAAFVLWVDSLTPTRPDESCTGIGFGCTPSGRDGTLILAIFLWMPAFAASVLLSAVVLLVVVAAKVRSGLVAGNLAAFVGLGLGLPGFVVLVTR